MRWYLKPLPSPIPGDLQLVKKFAWLPILMGKIRACEYRECGVESGNSKVWLGFYYSQQECRRTIDNKGNNTIEWIEVHRYELDFEY